MKANKAYTPEGCAGEHFRGLAGDDVVHLLEGKAADAAGVRRQLHGRVGAVAFRVLVEGKQWLRANSG